MDKNLSLLCQNSRNQIEKLIQNGHVSLNGKVIQQPSFMLQGGEEIFISIPQAQERQFPLPLLPFPSFPQEQSSIKQNAQSEIQILYEDESLLILNKPPMLVVHPAPSVKELTLAEWLLMKGYRLSNLNGESRAGIVHRLDKETSGAIVIAKDNATHQHLSSQLETRSLGRYYLALIDLPLKQNLTYECYMARNPHNRLKMGKTTEHKGRYSKSHFLSLFPLYTHSPQEISLANSHNSNDIHSPQQESLIAIKLQTGRTHQIRCHLEQLGRHILGDELYGYKGKWQGRILLHAFGIYLTHPKTGENLLIKAPLFIDMLRYITENYPKEQLDVFLQLPFIVDSFASLS